MCRPQFSFFQNLHVFLHCGDGNVFLGVLSKFFGFRKDHAGTPVSGVSSVGIRKDWNYAGTTVLDLQAELRGNYLGASFVLEGKCGRFYVCSCFCVMGFLKFLLLEKTSTPGP